MAEKGYRLNRKGKEVEDLLEKIDTLDGATQSTDGLMTKGDKRKLDEEVADMPLSILEIDELLDF